MPPVDPPKLGIRIRDALRTKTEEQRQVGEVLKDGVVVGQLPFTRVSYELLPGGYSKLQIELIVKSADIATHTFGE